MAHRTVLIEAMVVITLGGALSSGAADETTRRTPPAVTRGPKGGLTPAVAGSMPPAGDRRGPAAAALCLCGENLTLDGDIREFVRAGDDSQVYFVVDPFDLEFGFLQPNVTLCESVLVAIDIAPARGNQGAAGPTGFADSPARNGQLRAPTGFNIGWVFAAYSAEQDPDRDPSNGTGVYMIAIDVSAPAQLDATWGTQPIAFDVDGDGSRFRQSEIAPDSIGEVPLEGGDVYAIDIDTDRSGQSDVTIKLAEMIGGFPSDAVFIDPRGMPQNIDGFYVFRLIRFIDWSRQLPGSAQDQAVHFLDADGSGGVDWRDFGIDADIELAVVNVSALPNNTNPAAVSIRVWADAVEDVFWSAGLDMVTLSADFSTVAQQGACDPSGTGAP